MGSIIQLSASLRLYSRCMCDHADAFSPKAAHARRRRCAARAAMRRAAPLRCMRVSHRVIYHHAQRDLNTNHLSVAADTARTRAVSNTYAIYTRPRTNNRERQLRRSQWTPRENSRLRLFALSLTRLSAPRTSHHARIPAPTLFPVKRAVLHPTSNATREIGAPVKDEVYCNLENHR